MISDADYEDWLLDTRRNDHRLLLIELDYSDKQIILGHGRSNFSDSLNEIKAMQINVYGGNFIELTFSQPSSQEGYSWEIWRDGVVAHTTQAGNWSYTGVGGQEYQIAVASIKNFQYSKPWIIEFTPAGVEAVYYGKVGDWQDVGAVRVQRGPARSTSPRTPG